MHFLFRTFYLKSQISDPHHTQLNIESTEDRLVATLQQAVTFLCLPSQYIAGMIELPILHFNDVYRVGEQKLQGNAGTIDVTQFAYKLDEIRDSWAMREDGEKDGLVLFSGDLFSPSVESSVTRGSHMVSPGSAHRRWHLMST